MHETTSNWTRNKSNRPIERDRSWNSVANILRKSNPISCLIEWLMNISCGLRTQWMANNWRTSLRINYDSSPERKITMKSKKLAAASLFCYAKKVATICADSTYYGLFSWMANVWEIRVFRKRKWSENCLWFDWRCTYLMWRSRNGLRR